MRTNDLYAHAFGSCSIVNTGSISIYSNGLGHVLHSIILIANTFLIEHVLCSSFIVVFSCNGNIMLHQHFRSIFLPLQSIWEQLSRMISGLFKNCQGDIMLIKFLQPICYTAVTFYKHVFHDDVIEWKHFRVTGHLYGKFAGHRWIPRTKASGAKLWCFLWSAPVEIIQQSLCRYTTDQIFKITYFRWGIANEA